MQPPPMAGGPGIAPPSLGPQPTPPLGGVPGGSNPGVPPPQAVLPGGFDLSRHYPPDYQLLDLAAQMVQTALDTGGFIDEADVRAHVVALHGGLKRLLDNFDAGRAAQQGAPKAHQPGYAAPSSTDSTADEEPPQVDPEDES